MRGSSACAGAVTMAAMRLRRDGLVWRRAGDEMLVLDLSRSEYLSANATGSLVWERLAEGATPDELAQALVEHFAVDAARARADVDRLLEQLDAEGLLETDGPDSPPPQ
jgi:Coenzyme PQQ synthesis protein D (PqqD)